MFLENVNMERPLTVEELQAAIDDARTKVADAEARFQTAERWRQASALRPANAAQLVALERQGVETATKILEILEQELGERLSGETGA